MGMGLQLVYVFDCSLSCIDVREIVNRCMSQVGIRWKRMNFYHSLSSKLIMVLSAFETSLLLMRYSAFGQSFSSNRFAASCSDFTMPDATCLRTTLSLAWCRSTEINHLSSRMFVAWSHGGTVRVT